MSYTLLRLGRRYLLRRPFQSILVILGIALGVAVIVAIDLANSSASRAFSLSTKAVSGRATHQVVGGPTGVPEELYSRLRRELGLQRVAPVVNDYVLVRELADRPVQLMGIDPFAEAPFRSYLGGPEGGGASLDQLIEFLTKPNSVFLSQKVAEQNDLEVGDQLTLVIGPHEKTVTIVGLLQPRDELSRNALDSFLLVDITTAQELLDRVGTLTTIDMILPSGEAGQAAVEQITEILPEGIRIERPEQRAEMVQQMTAAFELNLSALSLLALVVGIFLIYNTVTFSVVQRRPVLGTLRAIGVTKKEIFLLILNEALLVGLLGALLGLLLGLFLGRGAIRMVTQTINDLYFVVNVEGVFVSPLTVVKGVVVGIGSTLLAALPPAWEASSVEPAIALRRSTIESRMSRTVPLASAGGVALGLFGLFLLLISTRSLILSFTGLFAIIIAFALLTPLVTMRLMRLFERPLGRLGVVGRMAPRDIARSLSRTSVAIAALMVAISVIIGVSVMIGSFRHTVTVWLENSLQADVYLSPPGLSANRSVVPMDPEIATEVASFEGVDRVTFVRDVTVASPDLGRVQLVAVSENDGVEQRRFKWTEGSVAEAWNRVSEEGAVFVSEAFAFRHRIGKGEEIALYTDHGTKRFPVVGIYYAYSSEQGTILMANGTYRELYDDPYISSIAAYAAPGVDVDRLVDQLRTYFAGRQTLMIRSHAGLRSGALTVFERAFAITGALQILATVVAFIGVLAALMSLQLERVRELGTLRALGMTRRQIWGKTMLETGLMGGTAGLWAMPTGLVLALILIYVINLRSFGWTLELMLEPRHFLEAFGIALLAALLAGLYPAIRLSRIYIAEAIRSE